MKDAIKDLLKDAGLPEFRDLLGTWMAGVGTVLMLALAIELMLRGAEWWVTRKTDKPQPLLPKDGIVNFLSKTVYDLSLAIVGQAALVTCMMIGYKYSQWRIPLTWYTLPAYFLAGEFVFYFFHRLGHEVRLFWCDHAVHHSSTELDITTNYRFDLFEWVPRIFAYTPVAMLGFNPILILLFSAGAALQIVCHTTRFGAWGWWDWYMMSPTNHQVHHAKNPIYIDKNYGAGTMFWDRLLGTYQHIENEKLAFGVTHAVNSTNLLKVYFNEYRYLWRDFVAAPNWKLKLEVLFGRPGYTFEAPSKAAAPAPVAAGLAPALEPAE
jgi:sterol desaturase/sphingolipid hydroxylase (fatty acid hydroxylase superfamily)